MRWNHCRQTPTPTPILLFMHQSGEVKGHCKSRVSAQEHNKITLTRIGFRPLDLVLNPYGNTAPGFEISSFVTLLFSSVLFSGKTSSEVDGPWGIDWQSLHHPKWRVSVEYCVVWFLLNLPLCCLIKLLYRYIHFWCTSDSSMLDVIYQTREKVFHRNVHTPRSELTRFELFG